MPELGTGMGLAVETMSSPLLDAMRIGTAGWSITRDAAASFRAEGSHLQRYARVMNCVEINSSFHRSHRVETYRRWADETPPGFRFAVKLPKAITHQLRLLGARVPLQGFLDEVGGLGEKLAVLLVQLPPSLAFEKQPVGRFFRLLRELHAGAVVCEPRHAAWFTPVADDLLIGFQIGRVAADPAKWPEAAAAGGWLGPAGDGRGAVVYSRWHGSPRTYWSSYDPAWLAARAADLRRWPSGTDRWCIFDNTAAGAALANALELRRLGLPGKR